MKRLLCCVLSSALLLSATGCSALLNREYGTVHPHSSTYYEREDLLRAENYQDLVNDLMLLVEAGASEGVIWMYPPTEDFDVHQAVEQACVEVQTQTPLGAYAVEYLTYVVEDGGRTYDQIRLTISYRRSQKQIQNIIHITGIMALTDLLTAAVQNGTQELVVQVGYFDQDQQPQVQELVNQIRAEQSEPAGQPWQVNFYPENGSVVIIEILLES